MPLEPRLRSERDRSSTENPAEGDDREEQTNPQKSQRSLEGEIQKHSTTGLGEEKEEQEQFEPLDAVEGEGQSQ